MTLQQKYEAILTVVKQENGAMVGIHNYGMLHDIADVLKMKNNSGSNLRYLSARIAQICRELIEAGYPISEYRIKCCSWTERETWHPCFKFTSQTS